jgi:hypothetical protein
MSAAVPPRARSRVGAAAALALGVLGTAVSAHAGEWAADAKSGCKVWDPNPQLEETVAWSGACANGFAEGAGTAQWRRGAVVIETDEGIWRNGRQIGLGVQKWPGGRYEGDLADGEPNGHGVMTLKQQRYDGEFRGGKPNGAGSLSVDGKLVQGNWRDGCLQGSEQKVAVGIPLSACR